MNEINESLYEIIAHANVPRTLSELADLSGMDYAALQKDLDALTACGRIALSRKGKYALPEKLGMVSGVAAFLHNGAAVCRPDDGSNQLRITDGRLRPMPGDRILVRPDFGGSCTLEAICSREKKTLAACVRIEHLGRGKGRRGASVDRMRATAVACDPRIPYAIVLDGDLSFVRNNEIALLEIDEYPQANRPIRAHALRVLGNAGSMLTRLRATAENHDFPTEFPPEVEDAARSLQREPMPEPDEKRIDLRDRVIFTIDGANSRDFDDAVSIETLPDGGYRLGVHIADVSHYVRPGSAVDREARSRGTSLYLPGYTVPMLPEALSNDLCSLMPDADRLAMSLFMDVSPAGRVVDHQLTRSIIRSRARLTYDGVNRFFEGDPEPLPEEVAESLLTMRRLAQRLQEQRRERGAVDFEMDEAEFVLDEKYEPTEILCPKRGESERLIEEFMLLANQTVARLAMDTQLPFLYRIHERPDPDRIHALEAFMNLAGDPVYLGEHPHPGMLQKILDRHAGDSRIEVIRHTMLRALKKAQYSEKPVGHYALALSDYCHFTSPIRRYPDLEVHRMLKLLLDGGMSGIAKAEKRMPELAKDCSQREQESVRAEREADDMLKAAWMCHQIGRKFNGTVSGVTSWGVYVTLDNTVEGLVHVSDLDDYYVYDDHRQQLVGSESGQILCLGQQVRVRALHASVERGEINFELIGILRQAQA